MSTATDAKSTDPVPNYAPVLSGLVPYLTVSSASGASVFYQKAFGATEAARHPLDEKGRTMHIHLYINGASLMLSDAYPEHGHPLQQPSSFNLTLQVKDIDAWWARAMAAGAESVMPVQQMFWGDRYGQLRDPFGVAWAMNQPRS